MITISKKSILPISLLIIAVLLRISSTTSFASYLVLCLLALVSVRYSLWSLVMAWFISSLNPEVFPSGSFDSLTRFVVIFTSFFRVMYQSYVTRAVGGLRPVTLLVLLFGIYIVFHALIFSLIPAISILKGVTWAVALLTMISGWRLLSYKDSEDLFGDTKKLALLIAIISVFMVLSPYGYTRNETGLNGLLNHPQSLGIFSGIFMVIFFSELISNKEKNIANGFAFLLFTALLFLTESRTGGVAFILSILLMTVISVAVYGHKINRIFPGITRLGPRIFITLMAVLVVLFSGLLGDRISSFFMKRGESTQFTEVYQNSRGRLIDLSMENINSYPLTGIGFGVPSDLSTLEITYDPIFGMPISAPTEKGVFLISITEELGLPGLIAALILLGLFFFSAIRSRNALKISLFFVLFAINFGEAVFFSPGGFGLLVLFLIGWVARVDKAPEYKEGNA